MVSNQRNRPVTAASYRPQTGWASLLVPSAATTPTVIQTDSGVFVETRTVVCVVVTGGLPSAKE